MLLVIDVGNTNSVLGVYDNDRLVKSWRMKTDRLATGDELAVKFRIFAESAGIALKDISDVIISSVVPPFMPALEYMVKECFGKTPLVVGPGIKTGLDLLYDNPKEIGADRVVNAVAGLKKYGGPLIIVDFGTATTFCAIDSLGRYLGGAICPGIGISTEALFQRAAKLPRIELSKPEKTIAKNTVNAMQSGIIFGYVGLVEGLVKRIKKEMDREEKIRVVATGGLAGLIASETDAIDNVDPDLTLEGLRIIYERNKKQDNTGK